MINNLLRDYPGKQVGFKQTWSEMERFRFKVRLKETLARLARGGRAGS
jgi:hypothetical protein